MTGYRTKKGVLLADDESSRTLPPVAYLACTRFSETTWRENVSYRIRTGRPVVYGTDMRTSDRCSPHGSLLVLEMNNDANRLMGVGFVRNRLDFEGSPHAIHATQNYNRFVYAGTWWLGRGDLLRHRPDTLAVLEALLFCGRGHMKRLTGISLVPAARLAGAGLDAGRLVADILSLDRLAYG